MSLSRHQAVGAYRRWEPQSFGDAAEADPVAEAAKDAPPPPPPEPAPQPDPPAAAEPPVRLPTADDIERMYEDARREGYAAGLDEGRARARDEALRLAALADGLDDALERLDHEVSEEVAALAIEIARRMVRHTLAEAPEAVVDVVRAALAQLPQAHARIHLNPADAPLVAEHLAEQPGHAHHAIVEDDGIARGGCRVAGATSEIDATVATRWRRILEGLGRDDGAWQEHD